MEKKNKNPKGIVMNRLIILRDRLRSFETSKVEASYLDETIRYVHENI